MRPVASALAAAAALACALALPGASGAHAGHGPTFVGISDFKFTPADVTVVVGDDVIWGWSGPGTNHSVTSTPGQAESFDSDPGKPASAILHPINDGFDHKFNTAGTFTYYCKVHAQMKGSVTVLPVGGVGDRVPPLLSKLRVTPSRPCAKKSGRCRTPGATLYYTDTEASEVAVEITRRSAAPDSDPLRSADDLAKQGRNSVRLPLAGLKPGAYRVTLSAIDGAQNVSKNVRVALTVRA